MGFLGCPKLVLITFRAFLRNYGMATAEDPFYSWWLNQPNPSETYAQVNLDHFPKVPGWTFKQIIEKTSIETNLFKFASSTGFSLLVFEYKIYVYIYTFLPFFVFSKISTSDPVWKKRHLYTCGRSGHFLGLFVGVPKVPKKWKGIRLSKTPAMEFSTKKASKGKEGPIP